MTDAKPETTTTDKARKSKSNREPRTIGTNLGQALLEASKAQHKPIPGMGKRKPKSRNRKPQNRRQGRVKDHGGPVVKTHTTAAPSAAAAMRKMAGGK